MNEVTVQSGVTPILMMPFMNDERVDHQALGEQVVAMRSFGVNAVGLGFASEVHRLDGPEIAEVLGTITETAGPDVAVMSHLWAGSTLSALRGVERAATAGASLVMIPLPPLNAFDDQSALRYFRTLADKAALPIVVQDAPGSTGASISLDVLAELLAHPRVLAVKVETTPSVPKIDALAQLTERANGILGGGGGLEYLHELRRGATGTMPSSAVADILMTVHRCHLGGDERQAQELFTRLVPILAVSARSFDTYVSVQKQLLVSRGLMATTRLRTPHEPSDARLGAELEPMWRNLAWDQHSATSRQSVV
jgi:2-keto-3-deoxy-L-arabinonate dehydratase